MSEERVLVVPAEAISAKGLFCGYCGDVDRYLPALMASDVLQYMPRSIAENDPSFKQLIPYAVLKHGNRVFSYRRGKAGGERRLHALWSIGVGGHICSDDGAPGADAYRKGFEREIVEEVIFEGTYSDRIVGLIYDDATAVGRVHLGVVHIVELDAGEAMAREPSLVDAGMRDRVELRSLANQMESWSALCLAAGLLD